MLGRIINQTSAAVVINSSHIAAPLNSPARTATKEKERTKPACQAIAINIGFLADGKNLLTTNRQRKIPMVGIASDKPRYLYKMKKRAKLRPAPISSGSFRVVLRLFSVCLVSLF